LYLKTPVVRPAVHHLDSQATVHISSPISFNCSTVPGAVAKRMQYMKCLASSQEKSKNTNERELQPQNRQTTKRKIKKIHPEHYLPQDELCIKSKGNSKCRSQM
jgi:hypothetical protein